MAHCVKQKQAELQVNVLQLHREKGIFHTNILVPVLMEGNMTFQILYF